MSKLQKVIATNNELIARGVYRNRLAMAYLQVKGHTEDEAAGIIADRGVQGVLEDLKEEL